MLRKLSVAAVAAFMLCLFSMLPSSHAQEELGTPDEAKALVEEAIAYYKDVGREASFAEFSNPKGKFVRKDLYVMVLDTEGTMLAHGFNRGLVGKNLSNLKDVNGVQIVVEMIRVSLKAEGDWVAYSWPHPQSKKLEPKKTWVKRYDKLVFGVGVYDKTRS